MARGAGRFRKPRKPGRAAGPGGRAIGAAKRTGAAPAAARGAMRPGMERRHSSLYRGGDATAARAGQPGAAGNSARSGAELRRRIAVAIVADLQKKFPYASALY